MVNGVGVFIISVSVSVSVYSEDKFEMRVEARQASVARSTPCPTVVS